MYTSIFEDTMANLNWKQIEELGSKNVPVLFPLGVIEEHGPHLPLGTDIYWSYAVCRLIHDELGKNNMDSLIAPPYYWGINHCTGAFPGTFSVRPETMKQILLDLFGNLHQFGFDHIYCVNYHGDALHISTILDAIKTANEQYQMKIRLLMEVYDLRQFHINGDEDYILLNNADYPTEFFETPAPAEAELLDIHAGAFETAAMNYFYPEFTDSKLAKQLKSYSLTYEDLLVWLQGGESITDVVPLGYAGNPAVYEKILPHIKDIFDILSKHCAKRIIELQF